MSAYEFDDDPARFSVRLAVGVCVVATVVLALATGPGPFGQAVPVLLGLAGAAGAVRGMRLLTTEVTRTRAAGSVWFVVGSVAIVGALWEPKPTLGGAVVAFCAIVAVVFVATDAFVGIDEAVIRSLGAAVSRSMVVLLAATIVAWGVHSGVFVASGLVLLAGYGLVTMANPLSSLVVLVLEAFALSLLLERAVEALDVWLPRQQFDARETSLQSFGIAPGDVPRGVYALLVFVVLFPMWVNGQFERLLDLTGLFGHAVRTVLQSPIPHALLWVGILLFGGIVFLRVVQQVFVTWVGRRPPKTMAYSAGGVVVSVVVGVVTALPPVVWLATSLVPPETAIGQAFTTYGVGATVLGLTTGALVALLVVVPVGMFVLTLWFVPEDAGGFGLGAASLLVASVTAGLVGAAPVAVFVGVAAALAVWDLGLNGVLVGREVGRAAETRRGEVIHAAGVLAVGLVALLVPSLGVELLGATALTVDVPKWRAVGAVSLLLVSLVAFARLATRDDEPGDTGSASADATADRNPRGTPGTGDD
ncbi:DUF7519 family protein [Haloarchaeobius sp. HRN-SO-5]|uniref:DUF7519 family protein n=1 Tax=Haloarchaeobius sp. HRN-SO-5 TaxID=3446118 RepID=UPI003EB6FC63